MRRTDTRTNYNLKHPPPLLSTLRKGKPSLRLSADLTRLSEPAESQRRRARGERWSRRKREIGSDRETRRERDREKEEEEEEEEERKWW